LSAAAPAGAEADTSLVRALGVRELAASIFNYTVGSGIFTLPAYAVASLGGAAPLAFLTCALAMAFVVPCLAEAGSRVAGAGGPYAYIEVALGPFVGFLSAVLLLLTGLSAGAAVAVLFARSVETLVGTQSIGLLRTLIVAVIAALAALNIRGVRTGARIIEAVTVLKLVPLIAFVVIGAAFIKLSNLNWGVAPPVSSVLSTAGLVIFAFSGIESALAPSGEVRNPSRTVPRAAFVALGAATLLYLAIQAVALGILGTHLADDRTAPLAAAAGAVAGPAGRLVLLIGASVSMLGYLSSNLLSVPRTLFASARDGFLPGVLSAVHSRYRTPFAAILAYAAIVVALALSGTFERLATISNLSAFPLYILSAIAVLMLRRRDVHREGIPYRIPGGAAIPLAACAANLWLIGATARREDWEGYAWMLTVSAVLFGVRAYRRRRSDST
jgi:amino acid transporter